MVAADEVNQHGCKMLSSKERAATASLPRTLPRTLPRRRTGHRMGSRWGTACLASEHLQRLHPKDMMALTVQTKKAEPTRLQHRLSLPSQHRPPRLCEHGPPHPSCLHSLPKCSSGFRVERGRGVFVLSLVLSKGSSRSSPSPEEAPPAGLVSWPRLCVWGSPQGPGRWWSQGKAC